MLIVGEEILNRNLLENADEKHLKNSSYYLTIGAIIPAGEEAAKYDPEKPNKMLIIEPRQVAWVVSREVFNIKSHEITALVTLRSTFTKKGLLALDVGLVDPDFEGPIGSIIINFSKNKIPLNEGDEFFRVVFIEHPEVPTKYRIPRDKGTAAEYAKERHSDIVQKFPSTFLNTEDFRKEIVQSVTENLRNNLSDELLLNFVKSNWGKILLGMLLFAGLIVLLIFVLYKNFVPQITAEDVNTMVQAWINEHVLKQPSQ